MALSNLQSLTNIARMAQNTDGKQILSVEIGKVVSKAQIRKRFRNIEELAESLKSEGLQSPIIVSPVNVRGEYVIQKGERRWRAAKVAGFTHIDVIVNTRDQSDAQAVMGELVENIQRDNLSSMEVADALGKLVDQGLRQADISRHLGKSRAYVSLHLQLLKLPECVDQLAKTEIVEDGDTLASLRTLYEIDPVRCVKVCEEIQKRNGITRKQAKELVVETRERIAAKNAQKEASGQPSTDHAPPDGGLKHEPDPPTDSDAAQNAQDHAKPQSDAATTAPLEGHENGSSERNSEALSQERRKPGPKPAENPFLEKATERKEPDTSPGQVTVSLARMPDDGPWLRVPAERVVISVSVLLADEQTRTGRLLTDRVAKQEGQAWVLFDQESEPECVDTNTIQVQAVGTSHG